jgi:hypothetical protein
VLKTVSLSAVISLAACASIAMMAACVPPKAPKKRASARSNAKPFLPDNAAPQFNVHERDPSHPARALVFRASGFPSIDAPPIDDKVMEAALSGIPTVIATSAVELNEHLKERDVDALVLPYGSAFPVDAWPRIQSFLRNGGGLAVLGGAPFHEPVRYENGAWLKGPRQTAFAHDLLIGPAEPVSLETTWKTVSLPGNAFTSVMPAGAKTSWALTLRLATEKEFPDEHGSAGPRDAVARPLVHVLDATGTPRGCPLLEIDKLRGNEAGARWIFAPTDATLDASIIRTIVQRVLEGAAEVRAVPERASVEKGETVEIFVSVNRPDLARDTFAIEVRDDAGKLIETLSTSGKLENMNGWLGSTFALSTKDLEPGLFHVTVTRRGGERPPSEQEAFRTRTGFWVRDDKLLQGGPKITAASDWLKKDGKAFPIVGTTYMASDAHRHYLFEPNTHLWDADFADMKKRGINFVRTGIWTAWSRVMSEPNKVDEEALSSLEAFVQTAAKHGIVVCFNFFAFLPPAYGGSNPYLDPRSIYAQKSFIGAFARRFKNVSWVHWDLINEPSYSSLAKLWRTRPIGDQHEALAWRQWVSALHQRNNETEAKLRSIWHVPDNSNVLGVPREEDFAQTAVQVDKRPRKVRDFREFTEDTVAQWAHSMRGTLKSLGGDTTLVTLGQDEGGIYERPTQQLMAHALDYTAVHTWWKNDDLLWDGVLTKTPGKPNLHQETGLMRLEDLDGKPWRSPEESALLLERKFGYAFASRGAGIVEWVWNVNPYMPLDEETTIGLYRADGTAKPELDALARFAEFFAKAAPHLDDFDPDPVLLVIPHARSFLGMTDGIESTKPVVRTLAERFGIVPATVSDLRIDSDRLKGKKLVIVPSPDVIDEGAAKALLKASKSGGTKVLITGAIQGDSYGMTPPSLTQLGIAGAHRPVAMNEKTGWTTSGFVSFESLRQETTRRADKPSLGPGKLTGDIWHEPLPLELARDREPLTKLLQAALTAANVTTSPDDGGGGVVGRVLVTPKVALLVAVNERAENATRRLVVDGRPIEVAVNAKSARLILVERGSGKQLAALTQAARSR